MNIVSEIGLSVLFFVKYALVIFLIIYVLFSIIVVKQIRVMNRTLDVGYEPTLMFLSFIHLGFALFTLFLAMFLL